VTDIPAGTAESAY